MWCIHFTPSTTQLIYERGAPLNEFVSSVFREMESELQTEIRAKPIDAFSLDWIMVWWTHHIIQSKLNTSFSFSLHFDVKNIVFRKKTSSKLLRGNPWSRLKRENDLCHGKLRVVRISLPTKKWCSYQIAVIGSLWWCQLLKKTPTKIEESTLVDFMRAW